MSQGNISPILPTPVNLTIDAQLEQQADDIVSAGSPLSRDEIIDQLTYIRDNGIALKQSHIDSLVAGSPVLTSPIGDTEIAELSEAISGNPWLKANPFATFMTVYLELAHVLSQIALEEGQESAESIDQMIEIAKDLGELIKGIAEKEMWMHIMSAVAAGVQGGFAIAGGIHGWRGAKKFTQQNALMQQSILQSQVASIQAGGQAGTIVQKSFDALHTMQKAELEAAKTLFEQAMQVASRRLSSATDAYKATEELIAQLLQNLQKIIDEAYKAHTLSR